MLPETGLDSTDVCSTDLSCSDLRCSHNNEANSESMKEIVLTKVSGVCQHFRRVRFIRSFLYLVTRQSIRRICWGPACRCVVHICLYFRSFDVFAANDRLGNHNQYRKVF